MIDRTPKYWTGDSAEDITEWLYEYTEEPTMEVRPIVCHVCGSDVFELRIDANEGFIRTTCAVCKTKKILLDGEEIREDASPRLRKCAVCKTGRTHNARVGFIRRESGDVKWVYIGSRCTACGTLASYVDWNVNYGPTDEMEQNI